MNSKVISNAKWIIVCRIVQSILALIISMLSARYLGPSNFGTINYAASVVSFFTPIMYLGINNILVQEIVENRDEEGTVLGTAIFLNVLSSILCICGIILFSIFVNKGETVTIVVCALYSIILIFQATEILKYWFQSRLLSKYTSIIVMTAYLVVSVYKFLLLAFKAPVYWFAVSNAFDTFLISIGMYVCYKRLGGQKFNFDFDTAKRLFSRGKYYIVSSMMVTIFAQTDKIMLKLMLDETAVGYYSAASSCAGMTSFVFVAIIDSMRPVICEKKLIGEDEYKINLTRLYSVIIFLALAQSLFMSVFSKLIILILYGKSYMPSVSALSIIVWFTTFSYIGSVRNIWILIEKKHQYLWIINLSGAILNVILNYILIPGFGVNGAAAASLITQIFTNVIIGYIIKSIRENNKIMASALNVKDFFKTACLILRRK